MADFLAHEINETITDPHTTAWFHNNNAGEVGDLCNFNFGNRFYLPNGASANITLGGKNYLIQQNWVNDSGGFCAMQFSQQTRAALNFVPVTPCRVADTRTPNGPFGGPILSGNTTRGFVVPSSACNIPGQRKASLRLDLEETAFADRGGYRVLERGKPDDSELIRRISSAGKKGQMPPAKSTKKLSPKTLPAVEPEATVLFTNGSQVRMMVQQESFEVVTEFGKLTIPADKVRRIDFHLDAPVDVMIDGEVLTLHCQSLDVLPGALNVVV